VLATRGDSTYHSGSFSVAARAERVGRVEGWVSDSGSRLNREVLALAG